MAIFSPHAKGAEPSDVSSNEPIPPLKDGDRLTRDEFERRYTAMPTLKKAELIEGVVHVPSPVRQRVHGRQHSHLNFWFTAYEGSTPGVEVGDNSTVLLDLKSMPQPDCLMFVQPEYAGQVRIGKDGYIEWAPDLVAEIAASSVSLDLVIKLDSYRRHGVREYFVWKVLEQHIDWFVFRDDGFHPLLPDAAGVVRSTVFAGLWLDSAALVRGDVNAVLATVQAGLRCTEHQEFVSKLAQNRVAL